MELVHMTTNNLSNVPVNAALLLISTTLKEMSMPTFRNKIAREVDKIQQRSAIVNIMCVLEEDDIEQQMKHTTPSTTTGTAAEAARNLQRITTTINNKHKTNAIYSYKFGTLNTSSKHAYQSLYLTQQSCLYPTHRLVGQKYFQACGIIWTSCSKNGHWDWAIFERVVFGTASMTDAKKFALMYPNETSHGDSNGVKKESKEEQAFHQLHSIACAKKELTYIDPSTGYHVLTSVAHERRGKCCGNVCRHCPFNHANVPPEHRAEQEKSLSPASVQDVIAWYDRMIASGNAALVWIVLRNFGFDGRLRKKRIKHYKPQIPERLVK